jgi:hypothetical protein
VLYDAGRHHPHLLCLANGDLVMTYVVRNDIQDGKLASYRRGCEALVSRDNGLTWDVAGKYVLELSSFTARVGLNRLCAGTFTPPCWTTGLF